MAQELPDEDKLISYYQGNEVDIHVSNEAAPAGTTPYSSFYGTIDRVWVDGDGGVHVEINGFIPTEDIPEIG